MTDGEQAVVRCETSKGRFSMRFYRDWSPHGYDRAVELYERGFFEDSHFFRAVPNFLVQFGITYSKDPSLRKLMHDEIPDDHQLNPPIKFEKGVMSYAGSGPNSRTSQMFVTYAENPYLGTNPWETPFGIVEHGMDNIEQLYSYGDMPPWGKGPDQGKIYDGPQYIEGNFPLIDKFGACTVERHQIGAAGYVTDNVKRDHNHADSKRELQEDDDEEEEEEEEEEQQEGSGDEEQDDDDAETEEEDEKQGDDGEELDDDEGTLDHEDEPLVQPDVAADHRELKTNIEGLGSGAINSNSKRLGGAPLSPNVGLVVLGTVAVAAYVIKSFAPARKLSQKKN